MRPIQMLILLFLLQSLNSSSDPAHLAIEAFEREDFAESVKFFKQAADQSPGSVTLRLHLANAQAHWFMQNPAAPASKERADAAEATFKNIISESPQNRLALWDLSTIYGMEGRFQDAQETLAAILRNDPQDSQALTASGTLSTMQIRFDLQKEKHKANVKLENSARIADDQIRESLRTQFQNQMRAASAALEQARQSDPQSSQPLVMLNLLNRMEAELAPTDAESQSLLHQADALVQHAMKVNQQEEQRPAKAQKKLNSLEPPPPLPGPGAPPPPPPRPPGLP
jgi:tetratricopeptide (TPR) repeat protein